ncbi:MAG: acyl-CoA thioesterase [Bacteroidetes bacterium]|jgi:acyl-CoA thioester hydrolase|nr:acyl-CoA thioesterase [Bacteroidota bacterium]MBP6401672.1 acyl-CoA thioesterase [Bacteroidia bacterium]MBK6839888.1 acyl-CoA thioesterase [Bacteroidota bacterium]MBK9525174.1 acyl-CoA thioesterase [Bacteroidota bacterium]MBK9543363.1 acyl-CoA thioesterase [Bacteroidota bacterium]
MEKSSGRIIHPPKKSGLTERIEIHVRFNEADPLGIVWHGHYIRYFEDGREAFGQKYGLGYLDVYKQGFIVPIVSVECDYKKSLRYGDRMIIETTYLPCEAAKIQFRYTLYNASTNEQVATGSTTQVFLDKEKSVLQLVNPPFFEEWKKKQLFV